MGFDFTILPGGGGQTGIVLTSLDLAFEVATCGPENPLACLRAVVDIFELAFDLFLDNIFKGRQKVGIDSASDSTALFFIPSSNPVIQMWGIGIRGLEAQGIPTSASGGYGYQAQVRLANAVRADLTKQFGNAGLGAFFQYHQLGFRAPNPDSNRQAIQQRVILDSGYEGRVSCCSEQHPCVLDDHGRIRFCGINRVTGFPWVITHPKPPPPKQRDCPCDRNVLNVGWKYQ